MLIPDAFQMFFRQMANIGLTVSRNAGLKKITLPIQHLISNYQTTHLIYLISMIKNLYLSNKDYSIKNNLEQAFQVLSCNYFYL